MKFHPKVVFSIVDGRNFCSMQEIHEFMGYITGESYISDYALTILYPKLLNNKPTWFVSAEQNFKELSKIKDICEIESTLDSMQHIEIPCYGNNNG